MADKVVLICQNGFQPTSEKIFVRKKAAVCLFSCALILRWKSISQDWATVNLPKVAILVLEQKSGWHKPVWNNQGFTFQQAQYSDNMFGDKHPLPISKYEIVEMGQGALLPSHAVECTYL